MTCSLVSKNEAVEDGPRTKKNDSKGCSRGKLYGLRDWFGWWLSNEMRRGNEKDKAIRGKPGAVREQNW